jgi:hypothetical protein
MVLVAVVLAVEHQIVPQCLEAQVSPVKAMLAAM